LGHGIYSETEMRADKRFKKSSDKIGIKSRWSTMFCTAQFHPTWRIIIKLGVRTRKARRVAYSISMTQKIIKFVAMGILQFLGSSRKSEVVFRWTTIVLEHQTGQHVALCTIHLAKTNASSSTQTTPATICRKCASGETK
jgi:hypothetical protein